MNKKNKFFSDFSKIATDAYGAFSGVRKELENIIKIRVEKIINKTDLIRREEFEILKLMVQKLSKKNKDLERLIRKSKFKKNIQRVIKSKKIRKK